MFKFYVLSLVLVVSGYFIILLNRRNFLYFLIYLEIIFNGILLSFAFAGYPQSEELSFMYFLILLSVIAAEAVVGLILAVLYKKVGLHVDMDTLTVLHG